MASVWLVLPAYNEEAGLAPLLAGFQAEMAKAGLDGRVVIVDDGSTDGTLGVIEEWSAKLPIELVHHKVNAGLGMTIRDGLRRAAELAAPTDVIVSMDADNTHSPSLIPAMIRETERGYDLVIASR